MENNKVELNKDQKAVVEREAKSIFNALSTLIEWVKGDRLTEEMRQTLPKLVDSYLQEIKDQINFEDATDQRLEDMKDGALKYYQEEVKQLKNALKNNNGISSIPSSIMLMFEKIDKWWDIEGFEFIRNKVVRNRGIVTLELGFSLDSLLSNYSSTPETDKENRETKVEYLRKKGYQLTKSGTYLIDNDKNRTLLIEMITKSFPSAKIRSFVGRAARLEGNKEVYLIDRIEVDILNIEDIENLQIEEKTFLLDETETN